MKKNSIFFLGNTCIAFWVLLLLILNTFLPQVSAHEKSFIHLGIEHDSDEMPVGGIAEWFGWHLAYGIEPEQDARSLIKETIDLHLEKGNTFIIWNCGRSALAYHSELPNSTLIHANKVSAWGTRGRFIDDVLQEICPLRTAVEYCRQRGMAIYGRLAMNRHYGKKEHTGLSSEFARTHPEYHEKSKRSLPIHHKLCYAIEEVQEERLNILLEIQGLGVDALVLDYARQIPILCYHDSLVIPFKKQTGVDPRKIVSSKRDDYADWFQFRANVLTRFMRKLRCMVQSQEKLNGSSCPIFVRIPDSAEWLLIAYGIDIGTWYKEDLIDGTILSPFPITKEDPSLHTDYHVSLAHRYKKLCFGGLGSKNLKKSGVYENTGFYHPQPVYALLADQYRAGVDAMTVYQSESLLRLDYLNSLMKNLNDIPLVNSLVEKLTKPDFYPDYPIGLDWHTNLPDFRHGLDIKEFGDGAL